MPPDQNQDHAPDPLHLPSEPTYLQRQPADQQQDPIPVGGTKVIQPLEGNTAPGTTVNPPADTTNAAATPAVVAPSIGQPEVSNSSISPELPLNSPPSPVQPGSVYPDARATAPFSKSDVERKVRKQHKRKMFVILGLCAAVIVLPGAGGFYYWYSKQDHSIYSKLKAASYSQEDRTMNFSYPAIMKSDAHVRNQLMNTPLAYTYVDDQTKVIISATYLSSTAILQNLHLTPDQLIDQIKTKSGSYVSALNRLGPNGYLGLYGDNCNKTITTTSGQKGLVCLSHPDPGYTLSRVVGVTNSYQYDLSLFMPTSVWKAHQQVWQKVEKSFSYQ